MSKLWLGIKILIAAVIIHLVWGHFHQKPAPIVKPTAAYVEPIMDPRSADEWVADCQPDLAVRVSSGTTSYWCRTPNNNDFDKDQALPADWRWL